MTVELEQAPRCCAHALENIQNVLDSAECLVELLAVAPKILSTARPGPVTPLRLLWAIATGVWSWRSQRKITASALKPIVMNRVHTIIDLEYVHHAGSFGSLHDEELARQWKKLGDDFS